MFRRNGIRVRPVREDLKRVNERDRWHFLRGELPSSSIIGHDAKPSRDGNGKRCGLAIVTNRKGEVDKTPSLRVVRKIDDRELTARDEVA